MEFWDHLFLFKRLYDQTMDPIAQQWDLTRMELDILLFLANAPAYDTAADIVERRRLTKSHVSVSIHSLIRRGWLERSYLPGNRKSAHLRLLPASSSAVADGQAAQAALRVQLSQGMTTEERAALESAFTRIGENRALRSKEMPKQCSTPFSSASWPGSAPAWGPALRV